jgi:hypothetical protein
MNSQPPQGTAPTAHAAPGARLARAGFLCGLISFIVAFGAGLEYLIATAYSRHTPGASTPGPTSGEIVLLILGAAPVALVGLVLSLAGHPFTARRGLARAGLVLSLCALVPVAVLMVVFIQLYIYCSAHGCFA